MRTSRILAWLLVCVVAASASAETRIDHADDVDFSAYKTWAWKEGAGTPAGSPEVQKWIVSAIKRELKAKGLREVTQGEPDLYVVFHAVSKVDAGVVGNYFYSKTWGFSVITADVRGVATGALVIDLLDRRAEKAVWRGMATETVNIDKPGRLRKKVDKVTAKLFKSYPPDGS